MATSVALAGLLPGKAVLIINEGTPRTLSIGASHGGVTLVAVEEGAATVEVDGKKQRIALGARAGGSAGGDAGGKSVRLTADMQGHFYTVGTVNGAPIRFVVDTGATMIALGAADALRANIDYRKGQAGAVSTANGTTRMWRVTLNTVKVGDVTLHNVDAGVLEHDMPVALLGMSFLNRMEMQRDGLSMTLRQRY